MSCRRVASKPLKDYCFLYLKMFAHTAGGVVGGKYCEIDLFLTIIWDFSTFTGQLYKNIYTVQIDLFILIDIY